MSCVELSLVPAVDQHRSKTDYREERRELQQAMAYDREMELQQMRESMAGPPRRHLGRVSPTTTNRPPAPNPNERE